jgi:hypothetical protein
MKQTITASNFRDAFKNMGRADQFSYDGLTTLFEHLEGFEECTGQEIELDVIALCCDFTEFDDEKELLKQCELDSLDEVEEHTLLLRVPGGSYIIENF